MCHCHDAAEAATAWDAAEGLVVTTGKGVVDGDGLGVGDGDGVGVEARTTGALVAWVGGAAAVWEQAARQVAIKRIARILGVTPDPSSGHLR